MERPVIAGKSRRKLSRNEITDILQRNVSLYRDEDTFVPYLIELAVYLLEYEYDWSQSENIPANLRQRPEDLPRETNIHERGGSSVAAKINPGARLTKQKECPFCGTRLGVETLICPSCKNMTR
jgi:hypothetical protein